MAYDFAVAAAELAEVCREDVVPKVEASNAGTRYGQSSGQECRKLLPAKIPEPRFTELK